MSARKALTIAILLSVSLFLLVQTTAGQEVSLDISGDCQEYSVTLSASGLDNGCYDAKIDITSPSGRVGEMYDPQKGWKSSFFYVEGDLCIQDGPNETATKTYQMKAKTNTPTIYFEATVKNATTGRTWSSPLYDVMQDCPQPPDPLGPVFWLAALLAMVLILGGVVVYVKIIK